MRKAVALVSGGLDSSTVLAIARQSYDVTPLAFDYGQRHAVELDYARQQAPDLVVIRLAPIAGSALTDDNIQVPHDGPQPGIPATYVPARNTIFLANALAVAENIGASSIFIGVNAVDYSGYPDCRPEYIQAFERMAQLATKLGDRIRIVAPLLYLSKVEIIRLGTDLGVDYSKTNSCYDPTPRPCGTCDSCVIRAQGFAQAGLVDPCIS